MDDSLYAALARVLKKSKVPMTCHDVLEDPEVRSLANNDSIRVSNYLGNMWRSGTLKRVPAAIAGGSAKARHAYIWPSKESDAKIDTLYDKPGVNISRDGKNIVIDMHHLKITIEQR